MKTEFGPYYKHIFVQRMTNTKNAIFFFAGKSYTVLEEARKILGKLQAKIKFKIV